MCVSGAADPPGADGLRVPAADHPAAHPPLLAAGAGLELPGRRLLRLHLPHHHRAGGLHPGRPSPHGRVSGDWISIVHTQSIY